MSSMPRRTPEQGGGVSANVDGAGRRGDDVPGIPSVSVGGIQCVDNGGGERTQLKCGDEPVARGGGEYLQTYADTYKPGPHHDERGGGAPIDDGGGPCGDGGGRRHLAPHKTKPKNVSGGLMARILAWERKNHVEDDRCTQSNTAGGARLGDR